MFTLEMIKAELNRLSASVGDEFDIPVSINGRLTRTLGRVIQHTCAGHCESERMEFSKQFLEILTKMGMTEIEALGAQFDPNIHEAVMHIEDEKYGEKEVVDVFRKGYKIGDKIIRHTMVKVAN